MRLIGRPQEALLCAKAKRQRQMLYLCESEATATMFYLCESEATATMFYLCESEATATTKRSVGTEINPSLCRRAILYLKLPLIPLI
ncbi:hypothetical protein FJQ98_18945 [Lysinibacillus agricola]|uniref:Uncharacterized protein n=1 Tax=Lysinibacillus agricola TaxID=2590012 RepID=A0ABX7AP15_9BACI|nr:hypothetical protein [Lysinibacillus agricola]QQP11276.1 hypothetical protein FJQ98_18945 [Lysinibacillus agricola]